MSISPWITDEHKIHHGHLHLSQAPSLNNPPTSKSCCNEKKGTKTLQDHLHCKYMQVVLCSISNHM